MINFRYHVVSLIGVFLALGIGVIMGATVIDRVTVDQLRNRLDSVEKSVGQTRKDNDAAQKSMERKRIAISPAAADLTAAVDKAASEVWKELTGKLVSRYLQIKAQRLL